MKKCYFLFEYETNSCKHIRFNDWLVYIIKSNNIDQWKEELRDKVAKYFFQSNRIYKNYTGNNLYKSLLNNIPLAWIQFVLQNEVEILQLSQDLALIEKESKILPEVGNVFKIFRMLKPKQIKVIIVGQDPYPQSNIADGIAFSTFETNPVPASLKNIFSELKDYENIDVNVNNPDLTRWVKQGCFLINSAWSVSEGKIGSHSNLWKPIVENLLRYVLEINDHVVLAFFGSESKTKYKSIVKKYDNVTILEVPHPSPNSSEKGFFNSQIFSKINEHLEEPIDWR
jgi:Uracil DNA glycosylase